ncbi:MAG: ATP-binding protein [Thermotogota bacterium]|nr:ATP-binding protein [Thermotogota bacterium]
MDKKGNQQNKPIDYKTLFLKAPLPALIFDLETGKIVQVDDLFYELSGYDKQQLVGSSFYGTSILRPAHKMKEFIRRIQQEEPLPMFTLEFKTADGEDLFVKVNYTTFTSNNNKLVLLTITDTSSQRRILESLKHHLTMERIIMHIATEYINIPLEKSDETIEIALGELARFVEADRAYVFEYHFDTGLTTNTLEWCAEGILPQKENLQKVPLSMVPEWVNQHINGKDMYIENAPQLQESGLKKVLEAQSIKSLLAIPMMKGKECIGFVGFDSVNNYHSYTQKEKKLLYLFSQLLVNIKMRKELVKAEEEANNLNKAKTEFLSNLSHELRTPLSGITGAIETTLETDVNDESRYLLEIALHSSLQLEKIFCDLYEIVKLNNGKTEIQPSTINPSDLIEEVAGLFKIAAEKKKLELIVKKYNLPETLYTDPKMLRQILDKLVDNAIKFTTSGRIIISTDYLLTTKSNGTLILAVSDTGVGIDEETQKRIYEIFFQKDLSLTKEFKGLGLGLPMISSIVEKMNGKIFLESVEGKGSTFTVRIPVDLRNSP